MYPSVLVSELLFSAFNLVEGGTGQGFEKLAVELQNRQILQTLSDMPATERWPLPSQPSSTIESSTEATSTSTSSTDASSSSIASTTTTSLTTSFTQSAASTLTTAFTTSQSTGKPEWALTTVFTQPTGCAGGMTQYGDTTFPLYNNLIEVVPGHSTTRCYPDVFLSSATVTASLPPYEQLVCPKDWETYGYNETYIICCPSSYGLYAPEWAKNTQRPGLGAVCTSVVQGGLYVDVTFWDMGWPLVTGTTVDRSSFIWVLATAFDGTAATSPVSTMGSSSATNPTSTSGTSSWTSESSSSQPTSSNSVAPPPSSMTSENSSTKVTSSASMMVTPTTPSQPADTSGSGESTSEPATTSGSLGSFTSQPVSISTATTSAKWTGPTAITDLPACGQTCFHNMLGQFSELGCITDDPACLCRNINFSYGIRDCSNGACGTSVGSSVIAFETGYYCPSATSARSTSPATAVATPTSIDQLPACGQTCFYNMLGQFSELGCTTDDPACLCRNVNFGYGIRDCSNGACGAFVGSTVIAFETGYYCPSATAARTTYPASSAPTPTAISQLPACGQTCFHNMLVQYSNLGCSSPDAECLCEKINFFYGIRDCSNGACGAEVASTVISFESRWCASATAAP